MCFFLVFPLKGDSSCPLRDKASFLVGFMILKIVR